MLRRCPTIWSSRSRVSPLRASSLAGVGSYTYSPFRLAARRCRLASDAARQCSTASSVLSPNRWGWLLFQIHVSPGVSDGFCWGSSVLGCSWFMAAPRSPSDAYNDSISHLSATADSGSGSLLLPLSDGVGSGFTVPLVGVDSRVRRWMTVARTSSLNSSIPARKAH